MRHWEEAGLLSELLDRHVRRLEVSGSSDWTVYHALGPFLRFLHEEPTLAAIVCDYIDELAFFFAKRKSRLQALHSRAAAILAEHGAALTGGDQRDGTGARLNAGASVQSLLDEADRTLTTAGDHGALERACSRLAHHLERATAQAGHGVDVAQLKRATDQVGRLERELRQVVVRTSLKGETDPGWAYLRLTQSFKDVDYAVSDDPDADALHNAVGDRIRGWISDASLFPGQPGDLPQPGVLSIQRAVSTLHLALATSLARGRSRWAIVRRFAARCETFDRAHLVRELSSTPGRREATLTLAFARYLFDAGFNPLVDATVCGLRPDVFDAGSGSAFYVEAKQYERVTTAVHRRLKKDVAQTLSTWNRLRQRWQVPEAFLLVFRLSGRPIHLERHEVRVNGGRLHALVVDLAEARDAGSRAKPAVQVDLRALLQEKA